MTKTNVGGLPNGSYIVTDNSAVIATLNKRIENLERYNAGLANESCEQQRKIAELEKERDTRDLEQQAKGVEDLARESYSGMTAVWMIAYADRLKDEAKALKDKG